jgi:hypothetical protein
MNPRNKLRSASTNSSSQVSDLLRKKVKGEDWLLCVLPDKKGAEGCRTPQARACARCH